MRIVNDSNRKWWILVALGGVVGLILLDETVVGVAPPSGKRDLGLTEVAAHWVTNAYLGGSITISLHAAATGHHECRSCMQAGPGWRDRHDVATSRRYDRHSRLRDAVRYDQ